MISRTEKANAIRALSMDAVEQAKSGHPGAPLGMADMAEVLWSDFLSHNPQNPDWINRDRFVLSNGHASMLIYALLHLTGYDLDIEEIKNFRQLGSKTPGHPEYGITPGVETTTGPLGQGIANAVGMALAEKTLAAQFNRKKFEIIDHYTYAVVGDGCLMEGISHEVCSLAGTLNLGKLIVLYDSNGISIDGEIVDWFTDQTADRFRAYGWQVVAGVDGHRPDDIAAAIARGRQDAIRPTLIECRTHIGFGSPNKVDSASSHGSPLGAEEIALTKKALKWTHDAFVIPDDIYDAWDAREKGAQAEQRWQSLFEQYQVEHPNLAKELMRRKKGELPDTWKNACAEAMSKIDYEAKTMATRSASKDALNAIGPLLPELLGGSADLTSSNLTFWQGSKSIQDKPNGNYINYGVREFGMAAMMNGMALYGGFKPYGGTFLVFSEYARNAIRMAALMQLPNIFVFTHDSIGVGEDGPTHQPIEQTATLRLVPNLSVWRPCDTYEAFVAWQLACQSEDKPFALVFSRQASMFQQRSTLVKSQVHRGGYILKDSEESPELIIIATGTEVELAVAVYDALPDRAIRVVSMPSVDRFEAQSDDYKGAVLPKSCRCRLVIEAGVTRGWYKYVGFDGAVLGLDRYGESAPGGDVYQHLGMTQEHAIAMAKALLGDDGK